VFERFTEGARQVVVLAQNDARVLRHNYVGTEHFLLGLLGEQERLAARVLGSLGITLEEARARVIRIVGEGDEAVTEQIPFTKHAINVLNLAQREALSLDNNFIGTEHLLLALVSEREGRAVEILGDFDAGAEKIREEIIRVIGGPGPRQTDEGFPVGMESAIELGLRRVVPVEQQMSDGTWVVSVEVWDHGLVVRWAASARVLPSLRDWPARLNWLVSDDVGTSYSGWGGGGTGSPERGFHYSVEFEPAPPPEAASLLIRHEPTDEELSISLTD
jgi:Clp amino terminal domain, pathogenicity island component